MNYSHGVLALVLSALWCPAAQGARPGLRNTLLRGGLPLQEAFRIYVSAGRCRTFVWPRRKDASACFPQLTFLAPLCKKTKTKKTTRREPAAMLQARSFLVPGSFVTLVIPSELWVIFLSSIPLILHLSHILLFQSSHQSRLRPELLSESRLYHQDPRTCAPPPRPNLPPARLIVPLSPCASSLTPPPAPPPTLTLLRSLFSQCLARKAFVDNWLVEGGDRCCVCLDWELSHFLPAPLPHLVFFFCHSPAPSAPPGLISPHTPCLSPKRGFEALGVGEI